MKKFAGCLTFIAFAVVVLAIAIGYSTWQVKQREKHQSEADATASEFSRFTGANAPPVGAAEDAQERYRKGHLLLINAKAAMVDEMYYTLPASLKAANAGDVGTEVWLMWDEHQVGTYANGGSAFKSNCDAVVYDVARNAIVARQHFEGEDPPQSVTNPRGSKEGWFKRPTDDILKFLQALPAR